MAYDSPSLGGYTFKNPPMMSINWEEVSQLNELADGGHRKRSLGYRLRATLTWEEGWIREEDLTGIMAVANDTTASLNFIPRPQSKSNLSYSVLWIDKFNFTFWQGKFGAYGGSITLVSPTVASSIPSMP